MAQRFSRIYSLLLVVSCAIVFLMLSWEYLQTSISSSNFHLSWTVFSGKNGHKVGNSSSDTNASLVEGLKSDQMRASTHAPVAETPMPVLSPEFFSKLPEWRFEDVYNQDTPPRQNTCAQSLQNSVMRDESLKEAFLPNIRLFLHKDNINMSEWNRLSHFKNPFGFMGYKYDDVMASVKLIPKPKEPLLPKPGRDGCVRCAVVGTGGILNASKMGKEIDAHDYVFRMNGALLKGHEEDVGNRTSVYVHTAHSINTSLYLLKKYGYTSIPNDEGIKHVMIPEGMRDFNWLEGLLKGERVSAGPYKNKRPRTYYGGRFNESSFYVLHQDFLRYVRNRFLKSTYMKSRFWAINRPTNGAFTLFLAIHTCDTVNAYGFMTEDYKTYPNYYYDKMKTNVVFYINHDYNLEMNTWAKLHNKKIMRLYQRTHSETGTKKPPQKPDK